MDIQLIALSGLNKAVARVSADAATIARAGTGLDNPLTADATGGATGPTVAGAVFPQAGLNTQQLAAVGDDDLAGAAVDTKLAQAAYAANVAVIRAQDDLEREFIRDIRI